MPADPFAVLGAGRGERGARDVQAGLDTPAARRHLDRVAQRARNASPQDALNLLRGHGAATARLQGLVTAVVDYCAGRALQEDWERAIGCFLRYARIEDVLARQVIIGTDDVLHLWPGGAGRVTPTTDRDSVTWACGDTHGWPPGQYPGPLYPVSRARRGAWHKATSAAGSMHTVCERCAEHADRYPDCRDDGNASPWEVLDRDRYLSALRDTLARDLRRGIGHLRDRADLDAWLVACGVQGALGTLTGRLLCSPAGEDVLHRALGPVHYAHYQREARSLGLAGAWALGNPGTVKDTVRSLLPAGPGDYEPAQDAQDEFRAGTYTRMLAAGAETARAARSGEC